MLLTIVQRLHRGLLMNIAKIVKRAREQTHATANGLRSKIFDDFVELW